MASFTLKPTKHELPRCASFDDERTVRDFEIAMRVHRAATETFNLVADETRVDSTYKVSGQSGSTYLVDIVDGSGRSDTCTCPDFLTNEINTCKHLEAVRRPDRAQHPAVKRLPEATSFASNANSHGRPVAGRAPAAPGQMARASSRNVRSKTRCAG
ncbi:MAG: SWIM zinc finger family protein [Polyangiaceae bacterium]